MANVDHVHIDSDERGFELHLWVDEDLEVDSRGRVVLNIQAVAGDLLSEVDKVIRPAIAEREQIKAEFDAGGKIAEKDDEPWLGETAWDYYDRTGNDEPLRDQADSIRDRIADYGGTP